MDGRMDIYMFLLTEMEGDVVKRNAGHVVGGVEEIANPIHLTASQRQTHEFHWMISSEYFLYG